MPPFSKPTIVVTTDGSHSLLSAEYNTEYHSTNGAINESLHVFIEGSLRYWLDNPPIDAPIRVFELGFGSGLNAYLTRLEAEKHSVAIEYYSIERYPVDPEIAKGMNFPEFLGEQDRTKFTALHDCPWDEAVKLSDYFELRKIYEDYNEYDLPQDHFNSFFLHAFDPKIQPDLWNESSVQRIYQALKKDGTVVSFSATGNLKRFMKGAGFRHETPDGAKGKRHMTRAFK